ncbi:MAG: hypothetical protein GY881_01045 [Gammaproteobacteria bacterium]|nr:hypothetical protein [Gammaproteobacteria bacterium]MCP4881331.1 hypothetical protein [Gammaproteobacteria bacterium]MDP6165316.1 DsrE family protein [Gammaproteobacteria bacterium]
MSSLIVMRSTPYGNTNAKDALDVALTLAAFEQEPALLYEGRGVLQLLLSSQMDTPFKHLGKILSALPMYDIEHIYIDKDSLTECGIDAKQLQNLPVQCRLLDATQVSDLFQQHQHVMVF